MNLQDVAQVAGCGHTLVRDVPSFGGTIKWEFNTTLDCAS